MQHNGTNSTSSVGEHLGIINIEFGHIPIGSLGEEVVPSFSYILQCKIKNPTFEIYSKVIL